MQSEGHDSEVTAADFGKLLFLASVSSRVPSANVLCSLGPTNKDIEVAGEATAGDFSEESVGKDLSVAVTAGEAAVGEPSHGHAVPLTVHDAHHDKEPSGMVVFELLMWIVR